MADSDKRRMTLAGLRVIEIGHFVAGPFCTRLLGDLGADIIKIEPAAGDPIRQWGEAIDGHSLWWSIHGRNKRSVALDLKRDRGREILFALVEQCDVLVENMRPGQLTRMGLSPERLRASRHDLIIAHVSGYGQDGPYRDRAAFGVIGEAMGGLRYLTNHPAGTHDQPPVRVGVSIGDSIAGLYAAFGVMAALWQRDRAGGDAGPRTIDVALTESVLSMMEGMLPEYGALGKIKEPTGGGISTAAPTNAYPTSDGQWVLIAANSDPLFAKLAELMERPDLVDNLHYRGNRARVSNVMVLDALLSDWTRGFDAETLIEKLRLADIPSSRLYTAADCAADPQYRYRGMVRQVEDPNFGTVLHSGIVPHIPENPGAVRWTGPNIGQHTMCCCAGLHPDDAGRELTEVVKDLCATKAHLRHWATLSISPMDLEDLLGDIETNNANLHAEGSFSWTNTAATMAYRCRGAGAVHPINGRMRDELLNETLFMNLDQARERVASWADDYNTERPHSSLGYQTPAVHAAGLRLAASRPVDSVAEDGDNNRRSLIAAG